MYINSFHCDHLSITQSLRPTASSFCLHQVVPCIDEIVSAEEQSKRERERDTR